MSSSRTFLGSFLLLLTAVIWGGGFVAQHEGMAELGPACFNGVRSLVGGLALIPLILFRDLAESRKLSLFGSGAKRTTLLWGGLFCGLALGTASLAQQAGIQYTSVGKAGFITTLYIVLVPAMGIFLKQKTGLLTWGCVLMALAGFYLLSMAELDGGRLNPVKLILMRESFNRGDLLCLLCAALFSIHILVISRFAPKTDAIRLASMQFLISGVFSLVWASFTETVRVGSILNAWRPILYAGLVSSGIGYTLQIIAQKWVKPVLASLIMSMESCFALLFGWLLLNERLSTIELCGCAVIFTAVIITTVRNES